VREKPLAQRPLTLPSPIRVPIETPDREEMLSAHAAAMERGEAGYIDPKSGLLVLTARFLADRGMCCERGCRHCPYDV
jgi:uncharacterized protein DUF5522